MIRVLRARGLALVVSALSFPAGGARAASDGIVTPFGGDGHWPFICGTTDEQGHTLTFELAPDEDSGGLAITIRRPMHLPIKTPVTVEPSPDERYLVLSARSPIVATPYEHQFYALLRADASQAHYDLRTAWRGTEEDVAELTPLRCR